jgi:outer membrane protein assembly factor BamB
MRTQLSLLTALILTAGFAQGADWAYWRGPEQNGVSREKGLVGDWSLAEVAEEKNVLWSQSFGGRSTPIIVKGRLFLNSHTNHNVNNASELVHAQEQVICADAATGEVLWRDKFNVFQTDIPQARVGWASMVGDSETGNAIVHSVSGIFRCYDPDGNVVWEHSLFEDFGKISGYGGRTQTPIIDENRVIVAFLARNWGETKGPGPKHTFYAFDKNNGKLLWTAAPGGRPKDTTYSNPIIRVINGQRQLICGNADGGIYAINARTGASIWGFQMSKRGINSSPVVDGNLVYISHGEDNIDIATSFGRIQCIDATGSGDVTETNSVWRVDNVKAGYTGLLVKDGILYVVADTGNMHAYDSQTGEQLWKHDLGGVGKGSPVWADGKIYVMEVNGNIHILKPSREGCETLSHVELTAASGSGYDEIYSSPAISDGRVFLVTRDRTICLGHKDHKANSDPIPPLADETPASQEIATIQLVPFEARITGVGEVAYELHAFDKNGRFVKKLDPVLEPQADLAGVKADGAKLVVGDNSARLAGHVTAKHGDLTATARLRVFPSLPWTFDFDDAQRPASWVNGIVVGPAEIGEEKSLKKATFLKGRPSAYVWMGGSEMKGYTIQADVLLKEQKRRMASIGVTANRYNFVIKGNSAKLAFQSWPAHLRLAKEIRFRSDPDIWYTMKLRVEVKDDGAHISGKVWKREEAEPDAWTLETVDPHPNLNGSPGLYNYALADSYFDNIHITANE